MINILHHLPQDLPEAFDQALGRISDRRYGDRIFQLVAVAETPLSGEQLNVALTVQPGNIMWDGTKLPRSSKQVVARCGGGLLQVDEEDGCVRFIHHSVVSHMGSLRVGMDGRQLARNWIADAETFMGSVCVTYLNFPDFDRRMVLSRNLHPSSISERLKKQASTSNPILASVVRHIKGDKERRVATEQMNIFPTLLAAKKINEDTPLACFQPYASKYWAQHTAHLTQEDGPIIDVLWRTLVNNRPPHVLIPWDKSLDPTDDKEGMLDYAIRHSHAYLYRFMMSDVPDFITFQSTYHWAQKNVTNKEDTALSITKMINHYLLAGPSFILAAYGLALLLNDLMEDEDTLLDVTPDKIQENTYAWGIARDLEETKAKNVTDCLWWLVEMGCASRYNLLYDADNSRGARKAIFAALLVLAMRLPLQEISGNENLNSAREAFWRCLDALSKDADESAFQLLWDYRFSVINWEGDAELLDLLAFRYALLHNSFKLARKIATNCAVEYSIFAKAVEEAKLQAKSMIHPKLLLGRLKEPTSYVMEQELAEDPTLAAARTYMVNKEYDKALDTIQGYTRLSGIGSINHKLISQIHVLQQRMVLRWVIDHRCKKVFQRLAFLRQAVLDWPTVLIYAITTYAHAGPPSDEDFESEREIFYGLLEELKQIDPEGNRTMGSEGTLDIDPGWTALHAAALWQPFAVEALLDTWPDIVNPGTRLGLTPLVVVLCGPLEAEDAFVAVNALLYAGAYTGALLAFPYLSPLDISIAYRPHRISRLLIKFGATRVGLVKGTQDLAVHSLVKTIALLESRVAFEGNSTEWAEHTRGVTSLEEYYRVGSSAFGLNVSWPQRHIIYELDGCFTLHPDGRGCHCHQGNREVYERLFEWKGSFHVDRGGYEQLHELEGCYEFHSADSHCICGKRLQHTRSCSAGQVCDRDPPDPVLLARYESIIKQARFQRELDEETAMFAEG